MRRASARPLNYGSEPPFKMEIKVDVLDLIKNKTLVVTGCQVKFKNNVIVVLFKPNDLKLEKFIIPIHEYKQLRSQGLI